jgi:YggT family protein
MPACGPRLRAAAAACTVRAACHCRIDAAPMCALYDLLQNVIEIYRWVLIAAAIMSWLKVFGALNRYNQIVVTIDDLLYRLTEPALRPLRRVLPLLGGVDVSFIVLWLLLLFVSDLLREYLAPIACRAF